MKLDPPEKVSQEQITLDVREIEPLLQAPPMDLKPWPEAMITLKDGRVLYIREARLDDVPLLLEYMKKVMDCDHDFYDIVGARVYAEILGWQRKRVKDPFTLIGLFDGMLAGFANGRVMNEDIAISLHTMTFARGGRIGYAMYYAKSFYALETLGCKEWWSTFESYNGWRMAGLEMAQPTYPWPEYQHELGGARVYYVTKRHWNTSLKNFTRQMIGADFNFNVTDEVRKRNEVFRVPDQVTL
ncbi:MAG: N-acetyltransferase [Chloroflexi bacterium]|nr:N-acetyltransferase [Chloroflexota bacterium]